MLKDFCKGPKNTNFISCSNLTQISRLPFFPLLFSLSPTFSLTQVSKNLRLLFFFGSIKERMAATKTSHSTKKWETRNTFTADTYIFQMMKMKSIKTEALLAIFCFVFLLSIIESSFAREIESSRSIPNMHRQMLAVS
jgi:hypothetical protein